MQDVLLRFWPVPALDGAVAVEKVVKTDSGDVNDGDLFYVPELHRSVLIHHRPNEVPDNADFELRFEVSLKDVEYLRDHCGFTPVAAPCPGCTRK
ncbi:MAG TPA: hypothetical protein PK609_01735 [Candidatus Paceibacterota bacterium]|nr:hypothetical protein [Candidatus Paceibacterota bacterium]